MLYGISATFTDKRVLRILRKEGIVPVEVFYSPMRSWWLYQVMLLMVLLPMGSLLVFAGPYAIYCPLLLPAYYLISVIALDLMNHSFALTADELVVVNPGWLRRAVVRYPLKDIERVILRDQPTRWEGLLGMFSRSSVEIHAHGRTFRYRCPMLNIDAFDENLTALTLDGLGFRLRKAGVVTEEEFQ